MENIGKSYFLPIFGQFFLFFAYFSPIFWIWGFFYSVDGQGFCKVRGYLFLQSMVKKVVTHFTIAFPFSLAEKMLCFLRKLRKAGTVDFEKHPARKVGTTCQGLVQCGPNVSGRFAFPGARNHRIYSISRFGKIFPDIFPEFSRNFPPELPQRPQKQPQPSRVF